MIRINQLRLPLGRDRKDMIKRISRILGVRAGEIDTFNIIKQSVDARKKPDILCSYAMDIRIRQISGEKEEKLVQRLKSRDASVQETICYHLPGHGTAELEYPPVIIGTGPAGLLCGLTLTRQGYYPVLLERGESVDTRIRRVVKFWGDGGLHPGFDMQSGKGRAGTFSDGRLNTLVKDPFRCNRAVLQILVEFGVDPFILYVNKLHIGTDVLSQIIRAMRREIQQLGGQVRFLSRVTDSAMEEGRLKAVVVNGTERIHTRVLVTVIGHSARGTFEVLRDKGIPVEAKVLVMGLRLQHPQAPINMSQYTAKECRELGPASCKMTRQTSGGRGVYSLYMRLGGYVVNASSEQGRPAVNGMSYHNRAGENANSALIVTVTPEGFPHTRCPALGGIEFQCSLEEAASRLGKGSTPVQLYGGFKKDRMFAAFGQVVPTFKGEYAFINLREALPSYISRSLLEVMETFSYTVKGFDWPDVILVGIGSRTSSPVCMPRDENLESVVKGIPPCGEGAGYAEGIISTVVDGIRTAEEIIRRYRPFETQELT